MQINQYVHLDDSDEVAVKHLGEGCVRIALASGDEPGYYIFLSAALTEQLRAALDTPSG